ncbi:MAG TPA: hypothetical protein GX743_05500 [Actinomycetales bacterium]|nr:hypothetical protein [Actinomycetales bacterium]
MDYFWETFDFPARTDVIGRLMAGGWVLEEHAHELFKTLGVGYFTSEEKPLFVPPPEWWVTDDGEWLVEDDPDDADLWLEEGNDDSYG